MQFYYELLAPAVAQLEENTGGARHVLYDRARTALLVAHLRGVNPPLDNSDIIRERLALEDAICNVEVKYRLAKLDRIQLKPPKRPRMVMRILRALTLTQPATPVASRSGRLTSSAARSTNGRLPPQDDSKNFLDSRRAIQAQTDGHTTHQLFSSAPDRDTERKGYGRSSVGPPGYPVAQFDADRGCAGHRRPIPDDRGTDAAGVTSRHVRPGFNRSKPMALKHMMASREVIVRGEVYATTKARSEPAAELNNDTIGPLVEKVGAVSIAELEKSITELQAARSYLQSESERIQRELTQYAHLSDTALAFGKTILQSVSQWHNGARGVTESAVLMTLPEEFMSAAVPTA